MKDWLQSREGPAQLPTGRPSNKLSHPKVEHRYNSAATQRQQVLRSKPLPTEGMLREFARALAEVEPEQRLALCEWVTTRGLLGLAREGGFEAAAALAYRCGDVLAGGVR
jgi:hypothetical protein